MSSKKEVTLLPLDASDKEVSLLGEVDDLNILDATGHEFATQGLYSVEIFSVPGSKERMNTFGFINLKTYIMHPDFFAKIITLNSIFMKIMESKITVTLDKKKGVFIEDPDGQTGFDFFMKSIPYLKFERNNSKQRDEKIDNVEKFIKMKKYKIKNLYVLPAGMREYEIKEKGKITEDEINDFYRNVLRDKNLVGTFDLDSDEISIIDPIRLKLQMDIYALYKYIFTIIDGKNKLMRGKWIKRGITHGTRNVFSGIPATITNLKDKHSGLRVEETILGVVQVAAAFLPLVHYKLKELFINDKFAVTDFTAELYDPKTLQKKIYEIDKKPYEQWTSVDGFNSIINRCTSDEIKESQILIEGKVFGLIFDNGKEVMIVKDINDVDENERKFVRPITYGELLFFITKDVAKKYPITVTRHPVIEDGSTYYSKILLYTTNDFRKVTDRETGEVYQRYIKFGTAWVNTTGLHFTRLPGLGADFDGDKGTVLGYMTEDTVDEMKKILSDISFFVSPSGTPRLSLVDDIAEKVIKTLSKKNKNSKTRKEL